MPLPEPGAPEQYNSHGVDESLLSDVDFINLLCNLEDFLNADIQFFTWPYRLAKQRLSYP